MPDSKLPNQYILRSLVELPEASEPIIIGRLTNHLLWPDFLSGATHITHHNNNLLFAIANDGIYLNDVLIASQNELKDISIFNDTIAFVDNTNQLIYSLNGGGTWQVATVTTSCISCNSANEILYADGAQLRAYDITSSSHNLVATLDENITSIDSNDDNFVVGGIDHFYIINDGVPTKITRNIGGYYVDHIRAVSKNQIFASAHSQDQTKYVRLFTKDGNIWYKTPGYYHGVNYQSDELLKPFESVDLNDNYPFDKLPSSNTATIMDDSLWDQTSHHAADDFVIYVDNFNYWVGRNYVYKIADSDLELIYVLNDDDVIGSSPIVSNLTLSHRYNLTLSNLNAGGPSVSPVNITQQHNIVPTIIASAPAIIPAINISQEIDLNLDIIAESNPIISEISLKSNHSLNPVEITSTPSISSVDFTQNHILDSNNIIGRASELDSLDIGAIGNLLLSSINAPSSSVSSITSTQRHNLNVDDIVGSPATIQSIDLIIASVINLSNIAAEPGETISTTITQNHLLSPEIISAAAPLLSTTNLNQINDLNLVDVTSSRSSIDDISITQIHNITNESIAFMGEISNVSINQILDLNLSEIVASTPIISIIDNNQIHNIANESIVVNGIVGEVTLGQVNNIQFSDIDAAVVDLPALNLSKIVNLPPADIIFTPSEITNIVVDQDHKLLLNELPSSSGIISSTIIKQTHNISESDIISGGVIVNDLEISENNTLNLQSLSGSSIIVDDVILSGNHGLTLSNIQQPFFITPVSITGEKFIDIVGIGLASPVIPNIDLNQNIQIDLNGIAASYGQVSNITGLKQTHHLTIDDLSGSAPVVGNISVVGFIDLLLSDLTAANCEIQQVELNQYNNIGLSQITGGTTAVSNIDVVESYIIDITGINGSAPLLPDILLEQDNNLSLDNITSDFIISNVDISQIIYNPISDINLQPPVISNINIGTANYISLGGIVIPPSELDIIDLEYIIRFILNDINCNSVVQDVSLIDATIIRNGIPLIKVRVKPREKTTQIYNPSDIIKTRVNPIQEPIIVKQNLDYYRIQNRP